MLMEYQNTTKSTTASLESTRESPIQLRVDGLKKNFGGQVVLDNVGLELRKGEVVLLRGENGSGKTTLVNILTGNLEPDAGTIHYLADDSPRKYNFPRRWWQELNPFDHFTPEFVAQEGVCRTWQDVRLFSSLDLLDNIAVAEPGHPGENPLIALFAPKRSSLRENQINKDAEIMLARLGLAGRERSYADKISLGQSKRVAIARAVAAGARVLFLDEPLAGLDRQGISEVVSLLRSLVTEHKATLVIIEHIFNQSYLHDLVTTHWLLKDGTIHCSENNGNNQVVNRQDLEHTTESKIKRPAWFSLFTQSNVEIIDASLPHGATLTRIRNTTQFSSESAPLLDIRGLVAKRGSRVVIGSDDTGSQRGFDLKLFHGEVAILLAPNGWGKSTLFAAISGLIPVDSGSIVLDGITLNDLSASERFHTGLRALPSDCHIFPSLQVKDILKLANSIDNQDGHKGLEHRVSSSLSGGERKRLAISAICGGKVGVYDEPFSALDELNAMRFPGLGSSGSISAQLILVPGTH